MEEKINASKHESYGTLSLISFLVPIAGIVLGIAYLIKDEKVDKKLGEHLLVVGIFASFVWTVGWYIFNDAAYI